jgi:hypothetical protein
MGKPGPRSVESKNVAGNAGSGNQAVSTHPGTTVPGSTVATQQPVPSIADAHSRRQKPDGPTVPVSLDSIGNTTSEALESRQQKPLDVGVETKH